MLHNLIRQGDVKMPPKAKYTREEIVQIALDLVSEKGIGALNARNLGAAMGTSTRPVFTAFKNMNELTEEVKIAAMHRFDEYAKDDPETGVPAFKNVGLQMILFATEQPKLFQLLYMTENEKSVSFDNLLESKLGGTSQKCIEFIMRDYGLNPEESKLLFRSVWMFTFGIGVLIASKVCRYDEEEVSVMLSQQFRSVMGLIKSGKAFELTPPGMG